MASHTDQCAPNLSIEGARTYAPGISTGAVAVFRAFSTSSPAAFPAAWSSTRRVRCARSHLTMYNTLNKHYIYISLRRAWLASCRRLAQWYESLQLAGAFGARIPHPAVDRDEMKASIFGATDRSIRPLDLDALEPPLSLLLRSINTLRA